MQIRYLQVCMSALLLLALPTATLLGQGLTGQVSGAVQDPTGNLVPGAEVELVNEATGQARNTKTDGVGSFVLTQLLPGTYRLIVKAAGFKNYEQSGIVVSATERVVLRQIALELGAVSETVSVTAEAARLQTQSAERSGLITTSQMEELSLKGRDYMGMMRLLPGVVDTRNREAPGWNNLVGININGGRQGTTNLTLDGVSNLDTGSMTGPYLAPGLDAIAEVKVLLTNYQAEYGRSSGGTINAVIKSGTRDFHGGAFYFKRNEALNANEYFNNRDGLAKPRYRFDYPGYSFGGPVLLPGTGFNRDRNKLFFFWSQEFLPRKYPTSLVRRTMPTEAERNGDFSDTLDTNGALIPIRDPLNNRQPFSNNTIPQSRIDPNGQALLNVFPLPNTSDPRRTFNRVIQSTVDQPRSDSILRLDWNIGPKTLFYARGIQDYEAYKGEFDFVLASSSWPQLPIKYQIRSKGLVSTLIHTFTPTLINEFTFGVNRALQTVDPLTEEGLERNRRSSVAPDLPQFFPQANPFNLIPNANFGGVQNAPQLNIEQRFPFFGTNNIWNWSDNLSKVQGPHNLKAGIYIENTTRNAQRSSAFNGTFDFGRNSNNPLDSNYAYANALLGSVNTYTEADGHPHAHARYKNIEWFVQDNWRVARRLTLDLGIRFYRIVPTSSAGDQLAAFDMTRFNRSKVPPLIEPFRDATGRWGRNPVTGELLPEVKIGTFAAEAGDPFHAMAVYDEKIMSTPGIQAAPRIGFALDIFGNGRTAIRGGIGVFPDRYNDDIVLQLVEQPPLVQTRTANYTTIRDLLSTPLSLSPFGTYAVQRDYDPPMVYNWSFGIQHDIGLGTVLDVAYVGSVARHLLQYRDLNAIAYGTRFRPENVDSTVSGNLPLPDNFLRPYLGFQNINYVEFASFSNYHSMQTQVNRRFTRNLTFGASWTWSKAMDLVDGNTSAVNPLLDYRMRNYGLAGFDRTHNFVITYDYKLPNASAVWKHPMTRWVMDGWEVSGITSFISGAPMGIGYSLVQSQDLTGASGNGVDSRAVLIGNPVLPKSERTRTRHFRTEVVQPPTRADFGIGNAPKYAIRGPGTNNWDISVFKSFLLGSESRRLQFRWEMYNAFNHTQFSGVDTTGRFDANGNQVNGRFGEYTSAQLARRMQLGLKLNF